IGNHILGASAASCELPERDYILTDLEGLDDYLECGWVVDLEIIVLRDDKLVPKGSKGLTVKTSSRPKSRSSTSWTWTPFRQDLSNTTNIGVSVVLDGIRIRLVSNSSFSKAVRKCCAAFNCGSMFADKIR
ncbi:MAG: hypothetical protein CL912_33880, partial [Deltaproteobacteria bacterium]|nr:hypothetical protein [Deltaproteobacteria bacterium]